jgi:hypothetical protein
VSDEAYAERVLGKRVFVPLALPAEETGDGHEVADEAGRAAADSGHSPCAAPDGADVLPALAAGTGDGVMFEIVVRRVRGVSMVVGQTSDMMLAYQIRNRVASRYLKAGFAGKRNQCGVWRLSKHEDGRRVRLAVYVQTVTQPPFSAN